MSTNAFEFYNSTEKAQELISHGGISVLGQTIGTKHDFDAGQKGSCSFYHRDRGEDLEIDTLDSESDFFADEGDDDIEYMYLFKNDQWIGKKAKSRARPVAELINI